VKPKIHPQYVPCVIKCACGSIVQTHATVPEIRLDICSKCHPFYTGKQRVVDTEGRVERFKQKYGKAATLPRKRTKKALAPAPAAIAAPA